MRIGLAQINPVTGDLDGNTEKICRAMDSARQNGCDLVVFPESAITGYMTGDLLEIDDFVAANIRLLHERVVAGCRDMAAVVGYVAFSGQRRRGDRLVNAAAVIQDGRIVATAAKQNLCRYRYYDETRYFTPGEGTCVATLSIDGVERRLGILICEDLWDRDYPADPYLEAVQNGAEMILVINASPFETGKWTSRLECIRDHQRRQPLPVAYVNSTAIGDNLKDLILFDGR
ncbi:MAG TPA: nitrilase-related carbon-nitrogen hydrolase, partial [Desulfosarcina sp.]|nr:nitrilase-related carbon-nitrogen hydrolase [Desulfosarcina sp.]